jgi:hypothetical protein
VAVQEEITDNFKYALIGGREVLCETIGVHLASFTVANPMIPFMGVL